VYRLQNHGRNQRKTNARLSLLEASCYVGRFAPSPSGPLHIGSLLTALTSYLDAKAHHGIWLVRMEDIDPPRQVLHADKAILHSLHAHGLYHDGDILFQSSRLAYYQAIIDSLLGSHHAYRCMCTRAQIKQHGGIYPGTCKHKNISTQPSAIRYINPGAITSFTDRFQGKLSLTDGCIDKEDMIIQRKDGLVAYNLAVVLDDIEQGITDIVRGYDLLPTTLAQLNIWSHFSASLPRYGHTPLLVTAPGQKLSKQNHAPAINDALAKDNILFCLNLLGISLSSTVQNSTINNILETATMAWRKGISFSKHEIIVP
jgi:glutamyl-Q tRNA(Asp) synthetase